MKTAPISDVAERKPTIISTSNELFVASDQKQSEGALAAGKISGWYAWPVSQHRFIRPLGVAITNS
jgi:hypothetical protein